jgi:hypothetical protein
MTPIIALTLRERNASLWFADGGQLRVLRQVVSWQ